MNGCILVLRSLNHTWVGRLPKRSTTDTEGRRRGQGAEPWAGRSQNFPWQPVAWRSENSGCELNFLLKEKPGFVRDTSVLGSHPRGLLAV